MHRGQNNMYAMHLVCHDNNPVHYVSNVNIHSGYAMLLDASQWSSWESQQQDGGMLLN